MNTLFPLSTLTGVAFVGVTDSIMEAAKEGGTLGGQALLFAAVAVLGWVVVALFKGLSKSNADNIETINRTTAELMAAANKQREEDRKHHQELVEAFKLERATNLSDRGHNFTLLMTIARDSAVAINSATLAAQDTTNVCRETAAAIRDLSTAFREMKDSAHEDAMNPVERRTKVVNTQEDPAITQNIK